jgi:membrane-associated phospholipid phosphatase
VRRSLSMVEQFDDAVARFVLSLRRRPGPNRAMYALSSLGDDGRVWVAAAAVESLRARRPLHTFGHAMVWLGIESALVNGPMKMLVRRPRPDAPTEHEHRLRIPGGTSFPSGHAASAATMATVLSAHSPFAPLWYLLAAGVGASRVHVGVHHASDVLAGWAVGAAIGSVARRSHPDRDRAPTEAP